MSYIDSPACKMFVSHCVCCGRPLVDATSVTLGIGPECRQGWDGGIDEATREAANQHVFEAAVAATNGVIDDVLTHATAIRELGLDALADKVARRFRDAARKSEVVIEREGDEYRVKTPFRRKYGKDFINAWRAIPGRRFRAGANFIPVARKKELWDLLTRYFGGQYAIGPKGTFRIPVVERPKQEELKLKG